MGRSIYKAEIFLPSAIPYLDGSENRELDGKVMDIEDAIVYIPIHSLASLAKRIFITQVLEKKNTS